MWVRVKRFDASKVVRPRTSVEVLIECLKRLGLPIPPDDPCKQDLLNALRRHMQPDGMIYYGPTVAFRELSRK